MGLEGRSLGRTPEQILKDLTLHHDFFSGPISDLLLSDGKVENRHDFDVFLSKYRNLLPPHESYRRLGPSKLKNIHKRFVFCLLLSDRFQQAHPIFLGSTKEKIKILSAKTNDFLELQYGERLRKIEQYTYRINDGHYLKKDSKYKKRIDRFASENYFGRNLFHETILVDLIQAYEGENTKVYLASTYDDKIYGFDMVLYNSKKKTYDFIDLTFNTDKDIILSKLAVMKKNLFEKHRGIAPIQTSEFAGFLEDQEITLLDQNISHGVYLINSTSFNKNLLPKYLNSRSGKTSMNPPKIDGDKDYTIYRTKKDVDSCIYSK